MPDSQHPPYNITQPRQLQRWLDINAQNGSLKRTRGFFLLPPFNIPFVPPPPSPNFQYSDIVGVFNYSSSNNFSIKNYAHLTNNGSYTLCIAYQQTNSLNMVRYRLIDGAAIPIGFTKYTGQQILKNFRLEIWSTGNTCLNVTSIQFNTTVLGTQDYRYGLDFAIGNASVICQSQKNINIPAPILPPVAGLVAFWQADSGVTITGGKVSAWLDSLGGFNLVQATAGLRPTQSLGLSPYIQFLGQTAMSVAIGVNVVHFFALFDKNVVTANAHPIFSCSSNAAQLNSGDGAGGPTVAVFSLNFVAMNPSTPNGTVIAGLDTTLAQAEILDGITGQNFGIVTAGGGSGVAAPALFTLGGSGDATLIGTNIRAILLYGTSQIGNTKQQIYDFLLRRYYPELTLPLNFAACTVPTPNT